MICAWCGEEIEDQSINGTACRGKLHFHVDCADDYDYSRNSDVLSDDNNISEQEWTSFKNSWPEVAAVLEDIEDVPRISKAYLAKVTDALKQSPWVYIILDSAEPTIHRVNKLEELRFEDDMSPDDAHLFSSGGKERHWKEVRRIELDEQGE